LVSRTDWLGREEAMKTADRENQNRYTSVVATRDHGTQDQNHPAQWDGWTARKTPAEGEVFFP
jgi:hypothetical protein